MGILSRFRDLMTSNVNALLKRSDNVEKSLDEYMRSVNGELGKVKAETASILAAESRAKRALDECKAEIAKLQRYAEKSVQSGNEAQAMKFLEQKAAEAGKEAELQAAYHTAAGNAANMKALQEKLTADINLLEARRTAIKGKLAAAEAQQKINAADTAGVAGASMLDELEEKAERAYDEAMALAELRRDAAYDIDAEFEQYEKAKETKPEEELAELKEKLGR
ncbi:PspA/IM30 family protein [Paenibacillus sp. PAMC21692]|uniref:PspA/IM30 family protein n=1 Tax=Paenibacillus sp. PAMC21692 TaxID=2762320 RepID=UPI00164D929A|nr:PspA/IM30 family protein [Paenibacillus sp. PAMC21692]QNK57315.1 PspA/IM30 family protein [Paenibacillus sp. PAMC21692]